MFGLTNRGNGGVPAIVELDADRTSPIEAADTGRDALEAYVSNIEQEQVRAAIQHLSVEFREIILLRETKNSPVRRSARFWNPR